MFVAMLKRLKSIAAEHVDQFESEGFTALFAMLHRELGDLYIACIQNHLRERTFRNGALISAELGKGNQGINCTLRKPHEKKQSWLQRIFEKKPSVNTFCIADRDESGASALLEIKQRGNRSAIPCPWLLANSGCLLVACTIFAWP